MREHRKWIGLLLLSLLLPVTGCGVDQAATASSEIELIEPLSEEQNVKEAKLSELYDYKVISGYVYPYVQEYAFSQDQILARYSVIPGQQVTQGQALLYADDSVIEKQIENLQETKKNRETEYSRMQTALKDAQSALQLKQAGELYQLDINYYDNLISELQNELPGYVLTSGMDGMVVNVGKECPQTNLSAAIPQMAVADFSKKVFKCDYIGQSEVTECEEIYAVINGKRIDVTYEPLSPAEYNRIADRGQTVYSTFAVSDPNQEIKAGDFGVIVLIKGRKDDSKLESIPCNGTEKTAVVARNSYSVEFSGEGYFEYPSMSYVTNKIEHGEVYFGQYQIQPFQYVEEGQVIATIQVKGDDTLLVEKQKELERQQQRFKDASDSGDSQGASDCREQIEKLTEELGELNQDYNTTQVVAQSSGIVVWMEDYHENDRIQNGWGIAQIAEESSCLLTVDNSRGLLNLGNTVEVTYDNEAGECKTVQGTVVTASGAGMTATLISDHSYISLPAEAIAEMRRTEGKEGGANSQRSFSVTANVHGMQDILMIPNKAVLEVEGKTYATIRNADGTKTVHEFLSGGHDVENYWVLEGLEEGEEVCLE